MTQRFNAGNPSSIEVHSAFAHVILGRLGNRTWTAQRRCGLPLPSTSTGAPAPSTRPYGQWHRMPTKPCGQRLRARAGASETHCWPVFERRAHAESGCGMRSLEAMQASVAWSTVHPSMWRNSSSFCLRQKQSYAVLMFESYLDFVP